MARPSRRRESPCQTLCKPQDSAHFFTVYLPQHNSNKLLIPHPFVCKFNGNVPKTVVLENSQGKLWEVELKKAEDKVYMGEGWEVYVRDNCVVIGEFLVFQYNGNAVFSVNVFDTSGCQRNEGAASGINPIVKVKPEEISDGLTAEIIEKVSEGRCVTNRDTTPDRSIKTNTIRFVIVVQDKMRLELLIPQKILRVHNIIPPKVGFPEKLIFRGQNGFKQVVTILQRPDRRVVLSVGWVNCYKIHKFVEGDECEFEVILSKRRKIKEITLANIQR